MVHPRLTLERELRELLGPGRNALIAARYYGFDGRGGSSLQAVGNEIGVTRERIRQIVSAVSESLSIRRAVSPTFDRTIAFVADRIPATAGEIEAGLRSQRLTSGLFRLEGVIKAAELLGRRLPFSITEVKGERLVYPRDVPPAAMIVRMARRLISRWGMATLSDVVAEAREVEYGVCDRKLVASALVRLRGFHWLEKSSGWFWLSDTRYNPVLRCMSKILSVANPINISELCAGIVRGPRFTWSPRSSQTGQVHGAVSFASMKSSRAFSKPRHATPTPLRAATSSGRHGSRALKPGASTRPYVLVKSTATRRPKPVNW
jgi:hypothetical protein